MAAQKQIAKTRTRQTVAQADQIVKQEQSLEMVQNLLLVSVTNICLLRSLVPIDHFTDRDFGFHPDKAKSKSRSKLKVLAAGKSAVADKLLRWLDGINHALSQGWLESTQLSIIARKDQPDHVIESYTFTIGYGPPRSEETTNSSNPNVASLSLSQSPGASITLKNAHYELGKLIRYLIGVCQTLPELPDERYMTVHLFYNDRCPDGYAPPGFKPNKSNQMLMVNSGQWQPRSEPIGNTTELGQHRVRIHADYLLPTAGETGRANKEVKIPEELEYTHTRVRNEANIGRPMQPRTPTPALDSQDHGTQILSQVRSSHDDGENQMQLVHVAPTPAIRTPQRMAIEAGMMSQFATQDSTREHDSRIHERLVEMAKQTEVPDIGATQPVTGAIAQVGDIDFKSDVGARLMARHDSTSGNRSPSVTCECGHHNLEGHVIQCYSCDNVQHRHCYAIETREAAKQHVCYTCLLEDQHPQRVADMVCNAQLRRLIWTIQKVGKQGSHSEIVQRLGYETALFRELVDGLKKQGILRQLRRRNTLPYILNEPQLAKSAEPGGLLHPLFEIDDMYHVIGQERIQGKETHDGNDLHDLQQLHSDDAQNQLETEVEVSRSDDETVVDELKSLGPKTPVQKSISRHSYVLDTPKRGGEGDMAPPAKRPKYMSSLAMSPANVSRFD